LEEDELPLGGVTGLGAFCGSVGAVGLTAAFSGEGLADGVAGPETKQCKGLHSIVDDGLATLRHTVLESQSYYLLEQLLDQEQMQVEED